MLIETSEQKGVLLIRYSFNGGNFFIVTVFVDRPTDRVGRVS